VYGTQQTERILQQIFIFSTVRDVRADPHRQRRGQRQWIRTPAAGFYGRRVAGLEYCCVVTLLDAAFPSQGEVNTPPEGFKSFPTLTASYRIPSRYSLRPDITALPGFELQISVKRK
jgi:hypothetical protein